MRTAGDSLVGAVCWVHGPNPNRIPLLAYIYQDLGVSYEAMAVDTDLAVANSDDVIFFEGETEYYQELVVQTRMLFEVPYGSIGTEVARLSSDQQVQVAQTDSGVRRAVARTGVLIRSVEEYRWDYVLEQKQAVDDFVADVELAGPEFDLVRLIGMQSSTISLSSETASAHLAQLMMRDDSAFLALTPESLSAAGLGGLTIELIMQAVNAASHNWLELDNEGSETSARMTEACGALEKLRISTNRRLQHA